MSISPATDIVLDVARAADPARYKRAVAKLDAAAATAFTEQLAAEETAPVQAPAAEGEAIVRQASRTPVPKPDDAANDKTAAIYRQFEAMALANMLEAAMPSNEGFFGKGVAGDTWKSMLIDQIAAEMAKQGGVGIAEQLARSDVAGRNKMIM
jgi:Rod binding domain-containing protein